LSQRSWTSILIVLIISAVAGLVWVNYSQRPIPGKLAVSGNVRNTISTVQAPAIAYPALDVTVGIPKPSSTGMAAPKRAGSQPMASQMPTVSGALDVVYVRQGDNVATGQPVAQLNTAMLDLGVDQAKAVSKSAHAQVAVLGEGLQTISDNQVKLSDARAQLATAEKKLADAKAKIKTGKSQLKAGIAKIQAMIDGPHPPGPWPPPPLAKKLAQLKATLAKLEAGEKKLNAASGQLATGKSQLATGASALRDAKVKARNARELLGLVATGQDILADVAEYRKSQATILSPVSGTITAARESGSVAMVGAPIVRVRPVGRTEIDTYLTPAQLGLVRVGAPAQIDFDSNNTGPLSGAVSRIADSATYPPTSFPTNIVHMTKTIRVTITLDDGAWAPPGTPVDVLIDTTTASR
jgi:multidrug resistance efflux pump